MNYQLEGHGEYLQLARGGGGGSSSGGGHSSGGGFSSGSSHSSTSYSSGSSGSSAPLPWWGTTLIFVLSFGLPILIIVLIIVFGKKVGVSGSSSNFVPPAGFKDPNNDAEANQEQKNLAAEAKRVFLNFQKAWQNFELKEMKQITTDEYYKKMVLELNVLKNYGRKNVMENVQVFNTYLGPNTAQSLQVFFVAHANDKLVDTKLNKTIYTDLNMFAELWTFTRKGKQLLLDRIDQTTAEASKFDEGIAQFSKDNGFYYDTDFGWLMMPNRGAIFGPAGFGNADINNHVIGYYKKQIVEFYSYEPKAGIGMQPFTVAQAILPKSYDDILVTEKSWYDFKPKAKGLNKIVTESVEFDKKFAVWAASQDQATSFELLATNFMERIYGLDFEFNIEVVDNVLYIYSPSANVKYKDMLDVLIWAFDEMKL